MTFVVLICVSDKKWWKRMKNQAHKLMCACTVLIYGCHYRYLAVIQKASRIFARISFFMSIYLFVCSLLCIALGFLIVQNERWLYLRSQSNNLSICESESSLSSNPTLHLCHILFSCQRNFQLEIKIAYSRNSISMMNSHSIELSYEIP